MNTSQVIRATTADIDDVAELLSLSFDELAISHWLLADPEARAVVCPKVFRIQVEHALEHGEVILTGDRTATMLYYPNADVPPPADFEERLREACGPYVERFLTLTDTLDRLHPQDVPPHAYISLMGRRPGLDNQGLSYLVRDKVLRGFDETGTPAYFEASNERLRDNFRRRGARDIGSPVYLPDDGPPIFPMWRDPKPLS